MKYVICWNWLLGHWTGWWVRGSVRVFQSQRHGYFCMGVTSCRIVYVCVYSMLELVASWQFWDAKLLTVRVLTFVRKLYDVMGLICDAILGRGMMGWILWVELQGRNLGKHFTQLQVTPHAECMGGDLKLCEMFADICSHPQAYVISGLTVNTCWKIHRKSQFNFLWIKSKAWCKTVVSSMHCQWSYHSLALSHGNDVIL